MWGLSVSINTFILIIKSQIRASFRALLGMSFCPLNVEAKIRIPG